jgi:superfamily II DNA/RNA helicase
VGDFKDFGLLPEISAFLKESSITKPTEVQQKAIPPFLKGEHLSVLAQTGSGKTLTYTLPIFHQLKSNDDDIPMDDQFGAPRAIILTPTRELNQQIFKVCKSVAHTAKLRIRQLVGGDKGKRSRRLQEEAFDILVCSPARLLSALERKEVLPKLLEILVLDEADQLLDMGFTRDLKKIISFIHKVNKAPLRQVALFSATWPAQYENFVEDVFHGLSFKEVICQGGVQLKRNIETFNIYLPQREKNKILEEFIAKEAKGTGLIFVNKKDDVLKLAQSLRSQFPKKNIIELHGNQKPSERKAAMDNFLKDKGLMVASDIAARGLDVDNLAWVLNYDLPFEAVYYIHRCGRTGRAGRLGRVYNFVTSADIKLMGRINEAILSQSSLALKPLEAPKGSSMAKKTQKKSTVKGESKKKVAKKTKKKSAVRKKTPRYKKKKR